MKNNKYYITSTAGNTTLFLPDNENKISLKLPKAEQTAFFCYKKDKLNLRMAGGEFCGGAILAGGLFSKSIVFNNKLNITVDIKDNNIATATFKRTQLIQSCNPFCFRNTTGYLVIMSGIAYFVSKGNLKKTLSNFIKLDILAKTQSIPAIGIIEVFKSQLTASIWVKGEQTLITENACTSGTMAAQTVFPIKNGKWKQFSGESIFVRLSKQNITVGAPVKIKSQGVLYEIFNS